MRGALEVPRFQGAPEASATAGELAMRKVILFVQVSLDGFFEGPRKELEWNMVDDELFAHVVEALKPMGAFLSGRVTYQLMAGFWPTADADPASTPAVKEFARIWRDKPKVVYSKTLTSAGWNTTIARDVVRGEVEELKLRAGGDLIVRERGRPSPLRTTEERQRVSRRVRREGALLLPEGGRIHWQRPDASRRRRRQQIRQKAPSARRLADVAPPMHMRDHA